MGSDETKSIQSMEWVEVATEEQVRARCRELAKERDQLSEELGGVKRENRTLRIALTESDVARTKLITERDHAKQDWQTAHGELVLLRTQLDEANAGLDAANIQHDHLNDELAQARAAVKETIDALCNHEAAIGVLRAYVIVGLHNQMPVEKLLAMPYMEGPIL